LKTLSLEFGTLEQKARAVWLAHIILVADDIAAAHLAELHEQEDDRHEDECPDEGIVASHGADGRRRHDEENESSFDSALHEAHIARSTDAVAAAHS